ncbi:HAMP domain-containing histidine kinase [Deferribacterales bacterium Es71-Z0220]|uniref:sensor histidine kinase n=1 Tax=Deferrivibrio essentukiensis TaxID=2880922 RepID=UPI001F608241|nr:HAMP domain-containing sensor histidine kinase [Deferrivibrio essentukiensis]MCB4204384.1 HAMP domain-containing histidine kinase [Deferrivibrio essentukiensis]
MKSFLKIFLIISLPIFLVTFTGFYFTTQKINKLSTEQIEAELETNLSLITNDLDIHNLNKQTYEKLETLYKKSLIRITIIDKNSGKVLLDNSVKYEEIKNLDNHLNRPEVKAALLKGVGSYQRYSNTINKSLIYYAKIIDDKVVRIAYPFEFLTDFSKKFTLPFINFIIILTLAILIIALYLAKLISVPVQRLDYIANHIEKGEKEIHFPEFKDKTMSRISSLIYKIYHIMLNKQKELADSEQRLNFILSIMNESILLLNNKNELLHINESGVKMFNIKTLNKNLLNLSSDMDTINFFSKIGNLPENNIVVEKYKNLFTEVYVKIIENYKLIVIKDISEKISYETFKTELVGNISHELKTPIAMILGYAETIAENSDLDRPTLSKFSKKIYDSSIRLNNLIDDILKVHKLETIGENFAVSEPVNLTIFKHDISEYYADSGKDIELNFDNESVYIEYEHLQSLLKNLLDNAIKYSTGNKVIAEISKLDRKILIKVSDFGPIIPESEKERIFERFYTGSKSRNKANAGTGLGLSIVKHITELYHGKIKVDKNKFLGNTFEITLYEKHN